MKLAHTRLLVGDVSACFRFYRDVLGLAVKFGTEQDTYTSFTSDQAALAIFDRAAMASAIRSEGLDAPVVDRVVLSFQVEDVDAEYLSLCARGAVPVHGATDQPEWGIRVAHFRDPAGNLVEIFEPLGS